MDSRSEGSAAGWARSMEVTDAEERESRRKKE